VGGEEELSYVKMQPQL